jgi:electron transfer flavoprotein alpha subunit
MRIVVCVKYVPVLRALKFDPATRRLVRDGVPGEVSAFDVRALVGALALRERHGGEVVVLTMGPPSARAGLVECLALGADRGVHLLDPALAGSDTLATARALAAAVRGEAPDLALLGRASVDAETGQVGPELAELLDWPQATSVATLAVDPATRTFTAGRETDDGTERVAGPLPAVVTVGETFAPERFPSKAERQAAAAKPIVERTLADVGLDAEAVGAAGSPTWVAGIEPVEIARRGEVISGESPEAQVAALVARLRSIETAPRPRPALPARGPGQGGALWVVAEMERHGLRPVTAELVTKACELAASLDAPVEALLLGPHPGGVDALAALGVDRVLVADEPALLPYTTEAHAAVLAEAIRTSRPRLVLLASTVQGRDLAPRVAARLGLGLTGDAIDLDLDAEGRIRQLKPAFGGTIVAPILSKTEPAMATVRPGLLPAAAPDPSRTAVVEPLPPVPVASRVRVTGTTPLQEVVAADLDEAEIVLGVGRGVGGPDGVRVVEAAAAALGAAVCATREVTDAGWLPRQLQVGLTGRAIAPRLYVGLGVSGAMEHMVGLRRAGTIVAVNANAKAPIFKTADLGLLADWAAILPLLVAALRG